MEQWQNLTFSLTSPNATFDNFLRNEHDAHYAPSLTQSFHSLLFINDELFPKAF